MTERELLAHWRWLADRRDEINAELSRNREQMDATEKAIRECLERTDRWHDGMGTKSEGLSCTVRTKWRAKYEPSKWQDLLKWAGESGHVAVVQRRLGDKAVMELVDNGIPLPDGLSVESYEDLEFRRS